MRMFSRNFSYNQNVRGQQQGYQAPEQRYNNLPLVPAPGLAIEYFITPKIGANLAYNRAIAGSKDAMGSVYKTTAYDWSVGGKGRFDLIGLQIEPMVGYVAKVFEIQNFATDANRIQVAPVSYRQIRLGSGVRLPLSSGAAISAGGAYLHTLGAGEILDPAKYFGGNALAGELFAAMSMPLGFAKGLDIRFGADYRRVAFAFTPNLMPQNGRIAGGAVDQYIGVNFGVGYSLDSVVGSTPRDRWGKRRPGRARRSGAGSPRDRRQASGCRGCSGHRARGPSRAGAPAPAASCCALRLRC